MSSTRFDLPSGQNWGCHRCTDCCRHHVIEVSAGERRRIEALAWGPADPLLKAGDWIVANGPGRFRLAHAADGACIFLGKDGLCRIHAQFGEAAKPMACRVFPFVLHPSGSRLAVGLRFSCPSAVANRGPRLAESLPAISELARLVVPEDFSAIPAPLVSGEERLDWPDFLRFVRHLERMITAEGRPVAFRLIQGLRWVDLIEKAEFGGVQGAEADEILEALVKSAGEKTSGTALEEPSRHAWLQFRLLLAQYGRKQTVRDLHRGIKARVKDLFQAIGMIRGGGKAPGLDEVLKEVSFSEICRPSGPLPLEQEEMLSRYFRVKIQSLHFCGRPFYGMSLVEGYRFLALCYPIILGLARWVALGAGRQTIQLSDLALALSRVDHHHGYSPAIGGSNARRRVRLFAARDDIVRLIGWFEGRSAVLTDSLRGHGG